MSESTKQKTTKFKVGKFTNGACDIFGIMIFGKLFGIVVSTDYPNLFKKWRFIKTNEFVDKYCLEPMFLKRYSFLKIKYINITSSNTNFIFDFIKDVCSNLPKQYHKHSSVINQDKRIVIIEKFSKQQLLKDYSKLTGLDEYNLLKFLVRLDITGTIKKACFYIDKKYDADDVFRKGCYIIIPSLHHGSLFVLVDCYGALDTIFNLQIDLYHSVSGAQQDFEKIKEIIAKNQKL